MLQNLVLKILVFHAFYLVVQEGVDCGGQGGVTVFKELDTAEKVLRVLVLELALLLEFLFYEGLKELIHKSL